MATSRLRKFTPDGDLLWMKSYPECKITTSPALYNGTIYLLCHIRGEHSLLVKALSMDSGDEQWSKSVPGTVGLDAQSLLVNNGTLVFPMEIDAARIDAKTNSWHAMNASNGEYLWHYDVGEVIWNAAPATPGDGTLLFGTSCGGASRITFGGKLIWRVGAPMRDAHTACTTGGGALGPNGLFYTEYTKDGSALVSAYQVSDGKLMWQKTFEEYGGIQYPAVGRLGPDGPLAVVVAIGENPGIPGWMLLPEDKRGQASGALLKGYLNNRTFREQMHPPKFKNAVVAIDATTGNVLWRWEEDVWDYFAAAGDEDEDALKRDREKSPESSVCMPDAQGIPLITGDGTVYASSGHGGDLTAIRDIDGNGIIDANEVSKLATGKAFLNSPSIAPGLLVAAPCWGPMYVFKGF
jgi:outer membrane protein assembly factor BamB